MEAWEHNSEDLNQSVKLSIQENARENIVSQMALYLRLLCLRYKE